MQSRFFDFFKFLKTLKVETDFSRPNVIYGFIGAFRCKRQGVEFLFFGGKGREGKGF